MGRLLCCRVQVAVVQAVAATAAAAAAAAAAAVTLLQPAPPSSPRATAATARAALCWRWASVLLPKAAWCSRCDMYYATVRSAVA